MLKRYIRHFNPSCPPLTEAIINPEDYIVDMMTKIDKIKPKLLYKDYSLQRICEQLNFIFFRNKIKFLPVNKVEFGGDHFIRNGINRGATNPDKYATIGIFLNPLILKIKDDKSFTKFKMSFTEVLKHELVHRGQDLKIKDVKLRDKVMRFKDDWSIKQYLSNKQEIMARAWQIVEHFRLWGLTSERIKRLLQNTDDIKITGNFSLKAYHEHFNKDEDEFKLLYKYMYLYLDQ